jgi:hypothetical protein
MAENFYTMQEVMEKLRKTEQEVQELVKQGTLRQYMDAGKPMFKIDDIDTLSQEIVGLDISSIGLDGDGLELEETSEIQLQPDESGEQPPAPSGEAEPTELKSEGGFGLSQIGDLSMADTNVGTVGINILSGTEDAFKLTEDTKAETQAADAAEIEEIEALDADANLESFGSGSGLLDLSLQADDTSLGAVLDDILPTGAEQAGGEGGEQPAEQLGLVEETEDLLAEPAMAAPREEIPMAAASMAAPAAAMAFVSVVPVDPRTNLFGIAMFLPLTAIVLVGIILTAAMRGIRPSLLNLLIETKIAELGLFWYILGGLAVIAVVISLAASLGGGGGSPKPAKVKAEKPKKEKPVKVKKKGK